MSSLKISFKKIKRFIKRIVFGNKNSVVTNTNSKYIVNEGIMITGGVFMDGDIRVGRYTSINGPNTDILVGINNIEIGSFCSIAGNVTIQEYNHNFKKITSYFIQEHLFSKERPMEITSKGPIIIGNDVWIGTHCVILSGAHIGHGAVIGANSVVTNSIPPYAIAVGSPARVLKYRFSEDIINILLVIEWWNWPIEKIRNNHALFDTELTIKDLDNIKCY